MSTTTTAKIRMFRLDELGDCFLVTFASDGEESNLLIDCGSFRNGKESVNRIKEITSGIKDILDDKPLDVVVGTHQHNDHLSGFVHCEDTFREIGVGQVWLSWLDDPRDKKAQVVGKEYNNLRMHLTAAAQALHASSRGGGSTSHLKAAAEVLGDAMGFMGAAAAGAPPKIPAQAVEILKQIGAEKPRYLRPGQSLDMPGLPKDSVRVHVLGPPRIVGVDKDDDPLFDKDPRAGQSYDKLAATTLHASRFTAATERLLHPDQKPSPEEQDYPFSKKHRREKAAPGSPLEAMMLDYKSKGQAWRNIDKDWLLQAQTLALYLDTYTNNSSLVLAIELVDSGKVLLFAADAQTGNWESWTDVKWEQPGVSTDDLLARTVFYKVGHHASHNATLVEAFEKMNHPDLVALIPVHKQDSNITKPNGWKMPAKNLFKRIVERTEHRVLQMDNDNPPDCRPNSAPAKASWKKVGIKPKISNLCVELDF